VNHLHTQTVDSSEETRKPAPWSGKLGWILIALLVIALIPLFILGIYDRPSADDYSYAFNTRDVVESGGGILQLIQAACTTSVEFMQNWQGLYSSAFLLALQPGIFGNAAYGMTPLILFVIIAFSFLLTFRTIERDLLKTHTGSWPLVSMLTIFFVLQCMPDLTEGFYWYNGAMNYTPFFCLTLINCVCAIKIINSHKRRNRNLLILLSFVLSFVISGGNHVTAVLNVILMLGFFVIALRKRRFSLALSPLAAIIGLLINVTSPGTMVRRSMFPESPSLLSTFYHSFIHTFDAIHQWLDLSFILLLIILTPVALYLASKTEHAYSLRKLIVFACLAFFLIVGLFCVPFYAMALFGEGRVENVIYFTFFFAVILLYGYGIGCLYRHAKNSVPKASAYRVFNPIKTRSFVALFLVGICGILLLGNLDNGRGTSVIAAQELRSGDAQSYAAQMDEREQLYLASAGKDVVVEELVVQPDLIFFADLQAGDDNWAASIQAFYHLNSLQVEES
jgi:hypothetical protein